MADAPVPDEPESYAAAVDELEAILTEIEDDAVDVDVLTRRVARAAVLIRWCRGRIDGARVDVERIVAELEPEADTAPSGTGSTDEDPADDEPDDG